MARDYVTLTDEQFALYQAMLDANTKAATLAGQLWDSLAVTDQENQEVTDSLYDQAHDLGGEVLAEDMVVRVEELLQQRDWAMEEAESAKQAQAAKDAAAAEPQGSS